MKISPKQIQDACVRVNCNKDHGTGFFISEETIITAWHVIEEYETHQVTIECASNQGNEVLICEGIVIHHDRDLDVAIVQLNEAKLSKEFLPLTNSLLRFHDQWQTFGFPFSKFADGQRLNGKIMNFNLKSAYDVALSSNDLPIGFDFSGLSGAPMVTSEGVSGIITWSTVSGLGAVSIRRLYDFFAAKDVPIVDNTTRYQFPPDFEDELHYVESNLVVKGSIDELMAQGNGYSLVQGSPGSGKSVIAATYEPSDNTLQVVGRYLIRIPGDSQPVGMKMNKESIMLWFEDLIQQTIRGEITPVEDIQFEKRIERLHGWMSELSFHYGSRGITGIIMIDGLDEILHEGYSSTAEFLSLFPEELPSNIRIIFSCTTASILTPRLKKQVSDSTVTITPLENESCRAYLQREFERHGLELEWGVIDQIILKSEGHPLYLKYLLEILKDDFPIDIDYWLSTLPSIDGDISKYYDVIWDSTVSADSDQYWTCLIASQLRQPVFMERFVAMLPESARYSFTTKFSRIRHLFKNSQKISLHHSSFSIFIAKKGAIDVKTVHDNISKSNVDLPADDYSVINLIHHFFRSNQQDQTIIHCNQVWADKCAVIHMHPDLIIDDIKEVELLCLEKGDFSRFIDVKLLLSRINFRYDNVLAKHAYDIADALIARNKAQDAMKYILRRDVLLVSLDEAMLLLKRLDDQGFTSERNRLLSILETRLIGNCERAEKQSSLDLGSMVGLLKVRMIGCDQTSKQAIAKAFLSFNMFLASSMENTENEKEQELIIKLKDEMFSWYHGYNIYKFNVYSRMERVSEVASLTIDQHWLKPLSMLSLTYKKQLSNLNEPSPAFDGLIEDIESLVGEFGLEDGTEKIVFTALMDSSKRSDIVVRIAQAIPDHDRTFSLRKSNGVDTDIESIDAYFNHAIRKGYVDDKRVFDPLPKLISERWEIYLKKLLERIGFITGKLYRAKADDDEELLKTIGNELQLFLKAATFDLKQRVRWDRSYALIEGVLPILIRASGEILIRYFPDQLSSFLTYVRQRSGDQFGVYTEGYRQIMFQVIGQLIDYSKLTEARELLHLLESHLDDAAQNRWERTPELLQLVQLYSQCRCYDEADRVYKKMLDTSMGPTWYKEDQFFMVGNVIKQCWTSTCGTKILRDFGSYLEFGSGELTFQRYVQQAMNEIPAVLAAKGELCRGIAYIKNLTLPGYEEIYANAHSSTIDVPIPGDGYILGANQLIIASAVSDLLREIPESDPMVAFAVVKTFISNDDTNRYFSYFLDVLGTILTNVKGISPDDELPMLREVINLITEEKLTPYIRTSISIFRTNLNAELFGEMKTQLLKIGVPTSFFEVQDQQSVEREYTEEDDKKMEEIGLKIPGFGKMSNRSQTKAFLKKAEDAIKNNGRDLAAKEIIECFSLLKEDGTNIWMGKNLGSEHMRLFEILRENFTSAEVLRLLSEFIANHETDDWIIANFLIRYFSNSIGSIQQQEVLESVAFHIKTIIQYQGKFDEKYEWLAAEIVEEKPDVTLANFLIWSLNYPERHFKVRGINALLWLAEKRPWLLALLHKEAMKTEGLISSEFAAYILKEFSKIHPGLLENEVFNNLEYVEEIAGQDHFMIRTYYWEIIQNLSTIAGKPAGEFPSLFSYENFTGSDVIIEDSTEQTSELIDDLNNLGVLSRGFCERYYKCRLDLSLPLGIERQTLVEKYINRSFFAEDNDHGSFEYIERFALNKALSPNLGLLQMPRLKDIMELPILKYGI